jgi:tRNA (mo5U34)-methyltransferase
MHELGLLSGPTLNMLSTLPADLPGWPLELAQQRFSAEHHGDYPKWAQALDELPELKQTNVSYDDTISITGALKDNNAAVVLEQTLQKLHPWRKGPFHIGGVTIDTEWRSDWKWNRVAKALGDMGGQRVLDIGCGNGYFGWRMLQAGASEVIGIDPTLLFCMQYLAVQHYTEDPRNWVLPLRVEEIPATTGFDAVFSMGVIYHRRDPQAHAQQLADLTAPGGLALLESIVIDGPLGLVPESRYARMRNVWCVPTPEELCVWLRNAGFIDVCIIDVTATTIEEQHSTPWMRFESLSAAIDLQDASKTIEGYPAPVRAMVSGRKPG